MTAVALAVRQGHKQVVDVLLKAGANPDIQDHVCHTIPDSLIPWPLLPISAFQCYKLKSERA